GRGIEHLLQVGEPVVEALLGDLVPGGAVDGASAAIAPLRQGGGLLLEDSRAVSAVVPGGLVVRGELTALGDQRVEAGLDAGEAGLVELECAHGVPTFVCG